MHPATNMLHSLLTISNPMYARHRLSQPKESTEKIYENDRLGFLSGHSETPI